MDRVKPRNYKDIVTSGQMDILRQIVQNKRYFRDVNPVHRNYDSNTQTRSDFLTWTMENGYPEATKLVITELLRRDPSITLSGPYKMAVSFGNLELVQLFLGVLRDKNPVNKEGEADGLPSPLHLAASIGNLEIVRAILEKIDDKNPTDLNGRVTPLHMAASGAHVEVTKCIIEAGIGNRNPGLATNSIFSVCFFFKKDNSLLRRMLFSFVSSRNPLVLVLDP